MNVKQHLCILHNLHKLSMQTCMQTYKVCHFFWTHLHLMPFNYVMTVRNESIAMCMLPSESSAAKHEMTMVWSAEFER